MKTLRELSVSSLITRRFFLALLIVSASVLGYSQNVEKPLHCTIYDIQYTTDPSGDSPLLYKMVTIRGITTGRFYNGFTIAEESGPWHSVAVYDYGVSPEIGDEIQLTGLVTEYYGLTQITRIVASKIQATGREIEPFTVSVAEAGQEKYESVLVKIKNAQVVMLLNYGEWAITDDATSGLICDDLNDYMYFPKVGDTYSSITGILYYTYGNFKLEPRLALDIESPAIPHYALRGDIVTMNLGNEILTDHYIEIKGDRIIGITSSPPDGLDVYPTEGFIFPGLIDSHNHPAWNVLGLIPFEQTFSSRYEWQQTELYDQVGDQFYGILDYGGNDAQLANLFKLAEVRAMASGATTIQGFNVGDAYYNPFARQGIGIKNAERFPSLAYSVVFPLRNDIQMWNALERMYWKRFLIHIAEGTDKEALKEFSSWRGLGKLDERTTIIHGVALRRTEFIQMANAGANLIWSPSSNIRLYGQTADIPSALAAGVNIALAPDWTESGEPDVLSEIKYASNINDSRWGGLISPVQFAEFVTKNAALALGMEDRIGSLAAGMNADLCVIPALDDDPYEALLLANSTDVKLTVANGRPLYGDPDLMNQFTFLNPGDVEDISICGTDKKIALKIFSHAINDSDKPFSEVMEDLKEAWDNTEPQVCSFLSYDPCAEVMPAVLDGGLKSASGKSLVPGQYSLDQNYPNPFDQVTTISYNLPENSRIRLRIYNSSGCLIRTLVDAVEPEGRQSVRWDAGSLAPGLYYYRFDAQSVGDPSKSYSGTMRMALVK